MLVRIRIWGRVWMRNGARGLEYQGEGEGRDGDGGLGDTAINSAVEYLSS